MADEPVVADTTKTDPEWEDRRLHVQRLKPPAKEYVNDETAEMLDAIEEKGGYLNTQMQKDETWEFFPRIAYFDYMGAAEFEWGQQHESLEKMRQMHQHPDYANVVASHYRLNFEAFNPNPDLNAGAQARWRGHYLHEPQEVILGIICCENQTNRVAELLARLARPYEEMMRVVNSKETTLIWESVMANLEAEGHFRPLSGWWSINENHWMAFRDPVMFSNVCRFLGIPAPE